MGNLYQFAFGYQPHYVVAESFADAEKTTEAAGYKSIETIECLGPYVLISRNVLVDAIAEEDDA